MALHEALHPIAWLSGKWSTKDGRGEYPEIQNYMYHEELEFVCIGQPMFNYNAIARDPYKNSAMQQEKGFLHIKPDTNEVAFIISQNVGMTTLEEGYCDDDKKEIILETVNLARMSFVKPPDVKKIQRSIKLIAPDKLQMEMFMETDSPIKEHLKATYDKVKA